MFDFFKKNLNLNSSNTETVDSAGSNKPPSVDRLSIIKGYIEGETVEYLAAKFKLEVRSVILVLLREQIYKNRDSWIERKITEHLKSKHQFTVDVFLYGTNNKSLAMSTDKQIALVNNNPENINFKNINPQSVVSFELMINNKSVEKFEPSTKIGSAIIGGLLFGGAGAVVGAVAGKGGTTSSIKKSNFGIKILTKSKIDPIIEVYAVNEFTEESQSAIDIKRKIQYICDILYINMQAQTASADELSVGDGFINELKKLMDLRDSGAITQEEFNSLKKSIIKNIK